MREMLKGTLVEVGYDVVVTEDGRQAWKALRKGDLQLAVLDWVMPGMDGVEVCRKIQSERAYHPIHVIPLTSKEGTENVVTALTAGASDYICKPFHPEELIARLKVGERNVDLQIVKTYFDTDQFTVSCFPSDINLVMLSIITNAAYAIADGMNGEKGTTFIIWLPIGTDTFVKDERYLLAYYQRLRVN